MIFTRLLAISTFAASVALPASAEKLEPKNIPALLDEVTALEKQVGDAGLQRNSSAMQSFRAAAASDAAALEFYLKCYKELYFTRDDAKEAEWRTWRDRNEPRLKDKAFALALRLQLQYLILTLQVQETDDIGTMIPGISRFLETISTSLESLGERVRMLQEPVTGTVFAKVFLLDRSLELGDWARSPLDLPGIFGKTIIPYLIENRPDQVATAWDSRIRFEQKMIEMQESPALDQEFAAETLPGLRWEKAEDLFKAGFEANSVQSMLVIVKTYSAHPSAPDWLREIREILEGAVYPTPEAPDPAAPIPPIAPATPTPAAPITPAAPTPVSPAPAITPFSP